MPSRLFVKLRTPDVLYDYSAADRVGLSRDRQRCLHRSPAPVNIASCPDKDRWMAEDVDLHIHAQVGFGTCNGLAGKLDDRAARPGIGLLSVGPSNIDHDRDVRREFSRPVCGNMRWSHKYRYIN